VYEYLGRMVEVANRYDVMLCHENEKDIYGDTLDRVLQIMQHVNGLYYVYDPANFLQVDQPAAQTLKALYDKVDYFHIKDVIAETGQIVPAGHGDGMIGKLIEMMDRDTVLTLEPHLRVFAGYAQIDNQEMKNKYTYDSNDQAFDAAVDALKVLLTQNGYTEAEGGFEKHASRT
ncbi:MAG: sugar phosphate isomerase/epimerase, partial [Clostridia bacterium]|nr:sugar phosphate isomerase/epimerase [Clostridia bacterium]